MTKSDNRKLVDVSSVYDCHWGTDHPAFLSKDSLKSAASGWNRVPIDLKEPVGRHSVSNQSAWKTYVDKDWLSRSHSQFRQMILECDR